MASAQTPGVLELAEEVLEVGVRLGLPQDVTGIDEVSRSPAYSTGVGLLLFARQQRPVGSYGNGGMRRLGNSDAGQLFGRVKGWFKGNL